MSELINQFKLVFLIMILCSTQIIFVQGTDPRYPDLVWIGPLKLKAPAIIQILTWELMNDSTVLVTIPEKNSSSIQPDPYLVFRHPTNITIVMSEASVEYHITIITQWIKEIDHPIKIIMSGGGKIYQTTIAHIRKDRITIQLFIITIEDRSSMTDNFLYSFVIGLSIGAAIGIINLLFFRKRYRSKNYLTSNTKVTHLLSNSDLVVAKAF